MKIIFLIISGMVAVFGQESKSLRSFVNGNAQFTAALYKRLSESNSGNFLVCPISAQVILALAHAGAGGNTAKQLSVGLRLPADKAQIQDIFLQLTSRLNSNEKYILTSANKLYLADRFRISNEFNNTAVNVFGAGTEKIDFIDKEQAASQINRWVEEKTLNKIKNLIKPNSLYANTVAVLVNAMYFKGTWVSQFDPKVTSKQPFFIGNTQKAEAEMMATVDYFNYYESNELNAQFLELPYEGDDVTMTIVLPKAKDGLPALEARIAEVLVAPQYHEVEVDVFIPKYKVETDVKLKPILEELGIVDAFTTGADFSGMGLNDVPIYISDVVQKAFIEVNEKGTTAAASTAALFVDKSINKYAFIADHPFIFFLKHKTCGILFIGRFAVPEIAL